MRLVLLFVFAVWSAAAQTNRDVSAGRTAVISNSTAETFQTQTNLGLSVAQRYEKVRMECIQARRVICGKIVKVLPDGLMVDSGYTNLMRAPLNKSWLIPGTVTAGRAVNLVEASQPDAVCIGLVFLTDLPKSRGSKPKLYDYVNIEGFPVGQYTYTSVGSLQRTVRQFTTKLPNATQWNLNQSESKNVPPK
ncbi:MAG TPA: hypothetical protein VIK53_05760 [Verrucomicrobiae bacterium]